MYFYLLSFLILGAGIKYIDDAFDEKIFSKKIAFVVAPLLGVLWAYTMLISPVAAAILLAILCGVILKGKIDNYAHLAGLFVIIGVIGLAGVELLFIPVVVFFAAAAVLDEVGHDFVDSEKEHYNAKKFLHRFMFYFFGHRWIMKVAILCIALFGIIPLFFFLAIVMFDYAYIGVRWYGQSKRETSSRPPSSISIPSKNVEAA